ncbi:MAG TPA: hypothetical protein VFK06_10560 [Candidatus Angelobacter sp.]|nr:hypothetical protein [Candidatus Angelobacter sp.]
MSTVAVESTSIQVLNAKTIKETLNQQPVSKTETYPITVTMYEQFGRAFIQWSLHPNYAIGAQDVVQLREGSTWVKNFDVTGTTGQVDTGHAWGSGLNASYWSWNYRGNVGWRQLVLTPNSTDI